MAREGAEACERKKKIRYLRIILFLEKTATVSRKSIKHLVFLMDTSFSCCGRDKFFEFYLHQRRTSSYIKSPLLEGRAGAVWEYSELYIFGFPP
jgi:hypothetical protein